MEVTYRNKHHAQEKKSRSTDKNIKKHKSETKTSAKAAKEVEDTLTARPCKEHSFLTDVADVREMEQGLLQLLEKFHSGKLRAFGGGSTFDQMDQIREQQERLARLHFDVDIQQDMHRMNTDEARSAANENLNKLIGQLQSLSTSIQTLHTGDEGMERKNENN